MYGCIHNNSFKVDPSYIRYLTLPQVLNVYTTQGYTTLLLQDLEVHIWSVLWWTSTTFGIMFTWGIPWLLLRSATKVGMVVVVVDVVVEGVITREND